MKKNNIDYFESGIDHGTITAIIDDKKFEIRTYERGVEDETLSCGTGATAVAIAVHAMGLTTQSEIIIQTKGGELIISFEKSQTGYKNICLEGPTRLVFKGEYQ